MNPQIRLAEDGGEFHSLAVFVAEGGGWLTKKRVMGMSCGFLALLFALHPSSKLQMMSL